MSWPIGASTGVLYPFQTSEQALGSLAKEGFEVAELFLQTPSEYTAVYGRRVLRTMLAHGIRVHSIHLNVRDLDVFAPYPPRRADADALYCHSLELAHAIGARVINWHGARRAELEAGVEMGWVWESAARWQEWAAEAGIVLTLEDVSWCMLRSPEEITAALERLPGIRFTFDGFQAAESGESPAAVARAMGEAISTVHLSDYRQGARHLLPGRGVIDWPELLLALAEIHYSGPLIIELSHLDEESYSTALSEARTFLEALIERLGLRLRLS